MSYILLRNKIVKVYRVKGKVYVHSHRKNFYYDVWEFLLYHSSSKFVLKIFYEKGSGRSVSQR